MKRSKAAATKSDSKMFWGRVSRGIAIVLLLAVSSILCQSSQANSQSRNSGEL